MYEFTELEVELFNRVDDSINNNDYKEQSLFLNQMIEYILSGSDDDHFRNICCISIIASIVCDEDDYITYDEDGVIEEDCDYMLFSDKIDDLISFGLKKDIKNTIIQELIDREKYELLNEMKKYEKNS